MDYSPPDSSVHGILQARILEWVATSFPGSLPDPGIDPTSSALQVDSLPSEPPGKPPKEVLRLLQLTFTLCHKDGRADGMELGDTEGRTAACFLPAGEGTMGVGSGEGP